MEEDSEQRKKRLKEMRLQADIAEDSGVVVEGSGVPSFLSNPLAESPSTMQSSDNSYAAPRFNYYTDPMNAYSSDKRSSVNVRPVPDYFPPPDFGGHPMGQFRSPHQESTYRQMVPPPTQASPTTYRNPVWNGPRGPPQYNFPFRPSGGGTYPSPRFESPGGPCPSGGGTYPGPRFESANRPSYNSAPSMNQWPNHSPNHSSEYIPIPSSEYSPNHSPAFRNSHNTSRGRGRGFWQNDRSTVSGRGHGQGSSSHGRWSNEDRGSGPDRYYKRSMVEDPWQLLKPIIWNSTFYSSNTAYKPENSKPLATSKSISTKTEGLSAVFSKPKSEPSLAEYLASAFNEAANTEENA